MNHKLLVVDDNRGCADLYKMRFEHDNWEVKVAFSAEEALDYLSQDYQPDAILLDIMLPKMQGDELLEIIRKNPETKNIKVVVLTALNLNNEDRTRICKHADECLLKIDVMPKELVEKVQKLVGKK